MATATFQGKASVHETSLSARSLRSDPAPALFAQLGLDFRTTVARSPEEVFDFLVDLHNAPQWEPNCQEVVKTSDGPIGKGTTVRAKKGMGRLESEIVEFERPARFASRDNGRGMSCGLDFRCDPTNGGTQVSGKLWMEPRGPMRGLMVLMRPKMKRTLGELPDNLRRVIEAQG